MVVVPERIVFWLDRMMMCAAGPQLKVMQTTAGEGRVEGGLRAAGGRPVADDPGRGGCRREGKSEKENEHAHGETESISRNGTLSQGALGSVVHSHTQCRRFPTPGCVRLGPATAFGSGRRLLSKIVR